jgi:hypothetical protein
MSEIVAAGNDRPRGARRVDLRPPSRVVSCP